MSFFRTLKSRISRPFVPHCRPATKRRQHKTRLQVEALEAREVLNAAYGVEPLASFTANVDDSSYATDYAKFWRCVEFCDRYYDFDSDHDGWYACVQHCETITIDHPKQRSSALRPSFATLPTDTSNVEMLNAALSHGGEVILSVEPVVGSPAVTPAAGQLVQPKANGEAVAVNHNPSNNEPRFAPSHHRGDTRLLRRMQKAAKRFGVQIDASDFEVHRHGRSRIAVAALQHDCSPLDDLKRGASVDLAFVHLRVPGSGIRKGFYVVRAKINGDGAKMELVNRRGRVVGELETKYELISDSVRDGCFAGTTCTDFMQNPDGTLTRTCCLTVECIDGGNGISIAGCFTTTTGNPVENRPRDPGFGRFTGARTPQRQASGITFMANDNGIWKYNEVTGAMDKISPYSPVMMDEGSDGTLYAAFGGKKQGIWRYSSDEGRWIPNRVAKYVPQALDAADDNTLFASFLSPDPDLYGTWQYKPWQTTNPWGRVLDDIAADKLAAVQQDFFYYASFLGLSVYNNGSQGLLTADHPVAMDATPSGEGDLYVSFPATEGGMSGTYRFELLPGHMISGAFIQVTPAVAQQIAVKDWDTMYGVFDSIFLSGTLQLDFQNDNWVWTNLSKYQADAITVGYNSSFVMSFEGIGVFTGTFLWDPPSANLDWLGWLAYDDLA